jgi:hypothetical protein
MSNLVLLNLSESASGVDAPEKKTSQSSATTVTDTEEDISVANLLRLADYFSIKIASPMSLRDIVNQYPTMFTDESRELGRLFSAKIQPGSWLVRRRGFKRSAVRGGDCRSYLAVDMARDPHRAVGTYEKQREYLPFGDQVLPAVVVVSLALIHYLKTRELAMGLAQDSLRCAETYPDPNNGTPQRLCVAFDETKTQLILTGFGDEISSARVAIAAGHKDSSV